MKFLLVLFCHVLLFGFALSSPVESNVKEKNPLPEPTTQTPYKDNTMRSINKEQVQSVSNARTEKPITKKRDVPEILTDRFDHVDDDLYEGKTNDDYENIQALRSYLDNYRNENSAPEMGVYRGSGFTNDYRFYNGESRRKRTAVFDGLFNKPDGYYEPEIQLTPEDIMALTAFRQQQRLYNNFPYGRWSDFNNPVDLPQAEVDDDSGYNSRPENFFDRLYDQRYQNWGNVQRNDKFIANRRRRSFLGNPRARVPLYRRAIL